MLNEKDLITLAKTVANANPKAATAFSFDGKNYSYEELNTTFRNELNEYAHDEKSFRRNKNLIFDLIETVIDDVVPKKVMEQYSQFAEIKTFNQGDKPVFTQRITEASKRRARQFITKVGLAGVYEVFKLDGQTYEVPTTAYGGAAQIGLEEFLDGRVTMADVLDVILEGLDEVVYREIAKALRGAVDSLQTANKSTMSTFDEKEMDRLLSIADAYGNGPSTIYCTYEFAATMVPAEGWVSNEMKTEKWNNGYLANYKGHRVIVLAQSYEDDTNTKKVIDPSFAYIMPNNGNDKPVKICFEGNSIVREVENADWSREVQTYKKMGVAAKVTNNICVYRNTSLTV